MDQNSSVLSQDAIDALLNSQLSDDADDAAPSEEAAPPQAPAVEPVPVAEPAAPAPVAAPVVEAAPPAPAAPQPVMVNAPPPPGVTPPPGVIYAAPAAPVAAQPAVPAGGLTEEQVLMMAGEAAEAAVAPVQGDIGIISGRVDVLEAAQAKIRALEIEIASLKAAVRAAGGGITLEAIKPLIERVAALEKGAKNTPLFNLYEKFTCSSCATHGAAQARARCGVCGKEGWFGRKKPA